LHTGSDAQNSVHCVKLQIICDRIMVFTKRPGWQAPECICRYKPGHRFRYDYANSECRLLGVANWCYRPI